MTRFDLALFGDPVDHSWSPTIHRAALVAAGLNGSYRAIRVDEAGFRRGCSDLRAGLFQGANVTMPHKRLAAAETDERSEGAERSGAVNTIVTQGSHLIGYNTDIDGIREVWREAGFPGDTPVVVLGAGGAAGAALVALDGKELFVSTRRPEAASGLAARVETNVGLVPWGTVLPGSVVVNATPVGMQGESLPAGVVELSAGLLDMTYGRVPTPAVSLARRTGLPHASGVDLLLAQARVSFTLWTGRPAPGTAMHRALQKAQATD